MSEEIQLAQQFFKELEAIKASKGDDVGLTDIRLLVENLTQKSDQSLYEKILAVAVKIHHLKDDFADMDANKVAGEHLPGAGLKLDAVVEATEKATNDIIAAAEKIQESVENFDADTINDEVVKIFEACGFQDITGQHITNVVKTFDDIESLVKAIIKILPEDFKKNVKEGAKSQEEIDAELMNGPQLSADMPTQDDIDKLFAES